MRVIVATVTRGMADWASIGPCWTIHDDVIKWRHFTRYWPFVRGIHRSPVNSPHNGQWRGALMFSSICVWLNGWVNNREAGDLRRHRAHYDVIVMNLLLQDGPVAPCKVPIIDSDHTICKEEYNGFAMTSWHIHIFLIAGLFAGNPFVIGGFPTQRPVIQSCDHFFVLSMNTLLEWQSTWWLFWDSMALT